MKAHGVRTPARDSHGGPRLLRSGATAFPLRGP